MLITFAGGTIHYQRMDDLSRLDVDFRSAEWATVEWLRERVEYASSKSASMPPMPKHLR